MTGKNMGSDEDLVTVEEAAFLAQVSTKTIRTWMNNGIIDRFKKPGTHRLFFRRKDMMSLAELKAEGFDPARIRHMAIRAIVKAKRCEELLESLTTYLGFSFTHLDDSEEAILLLYTRANQLLESGPRHVVEDLDWAKRFLSLNEEYLMAVRLHTGDSEPWKLFLAVIRMLSAHYPKHSPVRAILDHAARNVRHVAFLYVHQEHGARKAVDLFPGESYTDRLVKTLIVD